MAMNLSSPWVEHYRKIETFFRYDPEVHVIFDELAPEVKLYVDDPTKAEALVQLLPTEVEFGTVILKITVVPANAVGRDNMSLYQEAFIGNPILMDINCVKGLFPYPLIYIMFAGKVVQYFTDNLGDYNGLRSTLYQDIAKEIFVEKPGVFYCTEFVPIDGVKSYLRRPGVGGPLGEWP